MLLKLALVTNDTHVVDEINEALNLVKIKCEVIIYNQLDKSLSNYNYNCVIVDDAVCALDGLVHVLSSQALENIPKLLLYTYDSFKYKKLIDAAAVPYLDLIRKPLLKEEIAIKFKGVFKNYKVRLELARLNTVTEQLNNSIIVINSDGSFDWVNEGFVKMYEMNLDEFTSVYGDNVFTSDKFSDARKGVADCIRFKETLTYETAWFLREKEVWIQTTLSPVFDELGRVKQVVAVESDITNLKSHEILLSQEKENLITTAEHLNNANYILELQKAEIEQQKHLIEVEKKKTDDLLLNILPFNTAEELKTKGFAVPRHYKMVSVLFTDFKGFTQSCETLTPNELVNELDTYFAEFDEIIMQHSVEKIKTIGDAYMCCGGLPIRNHSNAFDIVISGLKIQKFMQELNAFKRISRLPVWDLRLGIHTGPVIAGVVGKKKFAYDIWGDTVNIASRMESSGEPNKVNISGFTYEIVKDFFDCTYRGAIEAKNKGKIDMYFVNGIKPEYAVSNKNWEPNKEFSDYLASL